MRSLFLSRITVAWGLLLAATLASWEMGHGLGFRDVAHASVAIILVSLVKVYLVMIEFMELRHAPPLAKWLARAWLVGLATVLIGLYWKSLG